jgi:hypothetical protein
MGMRVGMALMEAIGRACQKIDIVCVPLYYASGFLLLADRDQCVAITPVQAVERYLNVFIAAPLPWQLAVAVKNIYGSSEKYHCSDSRERGNPGCSSIWMSAGVYTR